MHPAALEWLSDVMKQVRGWGFDYLKLDSLYAGALPGRRHMDMPREVAYRHGLTVMREAMGADAFFLTCGAPILPSLGLCDALRVGPDVSGSWETHRDAILLYNPTTPGARNAIHTTLNRLWLQPLMMTDPDVAFFVETGNSVSPEYKQLLQDLAFICNFKATSDLPQWMTSTERDSLSAFLYSVPQVRRLSRSTFQIDDRLVDFSAALSLPTPPTGITKILGTLIGWLGSKIFALKVVKFMDDRALNRRLNGLKNKT